MYNTGNPIPSAALEDMADNAQVLDQLVNNTEGNVTDRTGTVRRSFQQIIMDMGFEPLSGSFQSGATLTQRNQVLQDTSTGVFYSWNGTLPKVVTAGSTPATSGGIGAGAWVDRSDISWRSESNTQVAYVGELQAAGVTPAQIFDTAQNGNLSRSTASEFVGCLDYGTVQNYEDYNSSINLADVEVVAHRGFSMAYPQNTMIAFTNCIKRGASSIELDLSVSSDGVVYVFHDSILDGLMEGTGTFTALDSTYIDSRKFQALNGTIFYLNEHIPRWVDVLKWAKRVGIKIYAEVKNVRTDADLSLLVQPVLDQNMSAQVGFSSFTTSQLQTIRSLSPRSFIVRNGTGTSWPTVITQLQAMGGNAALGWEKASVIAEPDIVTASAAAGIGLMPYTVFNVEEMKELTDLGVRRILCDVPMGASR